MNRTLTLAITALVMLLTTLAWACGGDDSASTFARAATQTASESPAPADTPAPQPTATEPADTPAPQPTATKSAATPKSADTPEPPPAQTTEPTATSAPTTATSAPTTAPTSTAIAATPTPAATPEAEATPRAVAVATAEPSATVVAATAVPEATAEPSVAIVATSVAADNMDTVQEVNQCEIDGSRGLNRQQIDDRRATLGNMEITLCWDPDDGANYTMPFDAQNAFSDTTPDEWRAAGIYRYGDVIEIPDWDGDAYCSPAFVPVLFWTEINGAEPLAYSEYERIIGGELGYKDVLDMSKAAGLWLIPYAEHAEEDWDTDLRIWLAGGSIGSDPGYCLKVADGIIAEQLAVYQSGKCRLCLDNQ